MMNGCESTAVPVVEEMHEVENANVTTVGGNQIDETGTRGTGDAIVEIEDVAKGNDHTSEDLMGKAEEKVIETPRSQSLRSSQTPAEDQSTPWSIEDVLSMQTDLGRFASPSEAGEFLLPDFQHLARIHITHLQSELSQHQVAGRDDEWSSDYEGIEEVGDILHRYITAIQDYVYTQQYTKWVDTMPETEGDRHVKRYLSNTASFAAPGKYGPSHSNIRVFKIAQPSQDPLRKWLKGLINRLFFNVKRALPGLSSVTDKVARFLVALTGGLSLVVPMLIMRIHQNKCKSLATTSVAVLLFTLVISLGFKTSNAETLGITAAYAAVLVVFVGTSS